jgi:hypothetical protein
MVRKRDREKRKRGPAQTAAQRSAAYRERKRARAEKHALARVPPEAGPGKHASAAKRDASG